MSHRKYDIPKSFKLFGAIVKVKFDNKQMDKNASYGHFDYNRSEILLQDKCIHDELSSERVKDCFYHEKVHAILAAMNERDLNDNEKFVDVFAKLLRQSDETAIF